MKTFSILIPSRGRPKELEAMLDSFFLMAKHPDQIEAIVRIDDDDPQRGKYSISRNIKLLSGSRFGGYKDNHRFIEECAQEATGRYLMQCVDTAEMLTLNWDIAYQAAAQFNEVCVIASHVRSPDGADLYPFSFPIITRKLYELAGEFCLGQNPSVDRCWEVFAEEMDCGIMAPVEIAHREKRHTQYQDKTAEEALQFYNELNRDFGVRKCQWIEIAKQAAANVRAQLNDNPSVLRTQE